MKFFKKMGVAVATLVLSVAAAITIGQVRESSYTQPENNTIRQVMKDYEDEEGLAQLQEICKQYVVDNAMVIDSSATDKIVNTIANMAVRDDGVIAVDRRVQGDLPSHGAAADHGAVAFDFCHFHTFFR